SRFSNATSRRSPSDTRIVGNQAASENVQVGRVRPAKHGSAIGLSAATKWLATTFPGNNSDGGASDRFGAPIVERVMPDPAISDALPIRKWRRVNIESPFNIRQRESTSAWPRRADSVDPTHRYRRGTRNCSTKP